MLDPNRITKAIEAVRVKVDALDPDKAESLERTLDVTLEEHFQYQQTQAAAHAMQTLTTAEAQVLYVALGEQGSDANGGWAARTDLPTKVVVTQVVGELIRRRVAS